MPEQVYSKVDPNLLLLAINRRTDIGDNRTDLCPENQLLQISTKILNSGTTFQPHKHNELIRTTDTTNEAWIVLKGSINAKFWDIDDKIIHTTTLGEGDCAVVFAAGHGFEVLEDDTVLYEIKNGPYYGQDKDKTFINRGIE